MNKKTVLYVAVIVTALVAGYVLAMMMDGLGQLETCNEAGLSECHLELDGLHLNAYGRIE